MIEQQLTERLAQVEQFYGAAAHPAVLLVAAALCLPVLWVVASFLLGTGSRRYEGGSFWDGFLSSDSFPADSLEALAFYPLWYYLILPLLKLLCVVVMYAAATYLVNLLLLDLLAR